MTLEHLQELHHAASPAPWRIGTSAYGAHGAFSNWTVAAVENSIGPAEIGIGAEPNPDDFPSWHGRENAELIAAMRNAFPALLAIAQAAQALEESDNDLREPITISWGRYSALVAALALLTTPPQTGKGDDSGESSGVEQ